MFVCGALARDFWSVARALETSTRKDNMLSDLTAYPKLSPLYETGVLQSFVPFYFGNMKLLLMRGRASGSHELRHQVDRGAACIRQPG